MTRPPLDALHPIPHEAHYAADPRTDLFSWSREAALRAQKAHDRAKTIRDQQAVVQAELEQTPEWLAHQAAREVLKTTKQATLDKSRDVQKARDTEADAKQKVRSLEKSVRVKALGKQAASQEDIAQGTSRAIRDALAAGKVPETIPEIELSDGTVVRAGNKDAEDVLKRAVGKDAAAGKD